MARQTKAQLARRRWIVFSSIAAVLLLGFLAATIVSYTSYTGARNQLTFAYATQTVAVYERNKIATTSANTIKERDNTLRELALTKQDRDNLQFQLAGYGKWSTPTLSPMVFPPTQTPIPTTSVTVLTPTPVVVEAALIASDVTIRTVPPIRPTATAISYSPQYWQTGKSGEQQTYSGNIPQGFYAIVGGYQINDQKGGVYLGFNPGKLELTIIDGFVAIVPQSEAKAKWDARINEAKANNWAMSVVDSGPIR